MNRRKPFISLTVKMAIAVMVGLTLSIGMFLCCTWLENNVFAYYYQNDPGYHYVMDLVALGLSFLTLLTTILIYNGKLLSRIAILSFNIQKVSDGDLEHRVYPLRNDELGALAVSVDNMRTSIIQKHQNERDAWQANQQLITEMSHDIRTPLTSLIGYLDIIEDVEFSSKEELDRYVSACRDKAFQLKDLSDKLFQYFLVYGRQVEKELEAFDASILFQQILMEHSAELMGYGYKVDFLFSIPEVDVMVDISRTRRLFDNIFSNIMKYGDSKGMVSIDARGDGGKILIEIENQIAANANKVESTKIGLKTCEKICSVFGGQFLYVEEDQRFSVKVILPMVENEPNLMIMDETDLEIMKEQGE